MTFQVRSTVPRIVCALLRGDAFRVTTGVNIGDGLDPAAGPVNGDIYSLCARARPEPAELLHRSIPGGPALARACAVGAGGAPLVPTLRVTFMDSTGQGLRALLLGAPDGTPWCMPLEPMIPGEDYTLIAQEPTEGPLPQPDTGCAGLTRGTLIDLAAGERRPVETLRPGDLVKTRDNGPMPLLWAGSYLRRAAGPLAPVVVAPGVLGNREELIVSQQQRLAPAGAAPRPAGAFANGETVRLRAGGFAEYYQLLLAAPQIVFASGAPVESLTAEPAALAAFDPSARQRLKAALKGSGDARRPQVPAAAPAPRHVVQHAG